MAVLKQLNLSYPFGISKIRKLKVGQRVAISGRVFTGRDRLNRHLADGGMCPVTFKDGALFHCGPIAVQKDGRWLIRSAGPTTSARQDAYTPDLIEKHQIRIIIGKGGMGEATRAACIKFGCVYLQTIGGAGALLAATIKSVNRVHFLKEFGCADALWDLETEGLPAVVAIDSNGRSIFRRIAQSSRIALSDLFERRVKLD